MKAERTYKVISLFAGCGWLDLWFRGNFEFLGKKYARNPFDTIWANDINKDACISYSKYFWHSINCGNIWDFIDQALIPSDCDVVLGGFPCQDFSHAWKRRGFTSERGKLYQAMIEVIRKTNPKIFLAENVKWLLTMDWWSAIRTIVQDFSELWYHVSYKLLTASDYGVPQSRERVIIVWTRKKILPEFVFPTDETGEAIKKITSRRAISDLIGKKEGELENHFWSKAKKNKWQWNTIIDPDKPGPTMRSEHHGNIEFHWAENRRLSAREAARIQSFPDDFAFYPSTSAAYKQIGNAVPPVLWWHIAKALWVFLNANNLW